MNSLNLKFQKKLDMFFGENFYILESDYKDTLHNVTVRHSKCNKTFSLPPNEFAKKSKVYRYETTCPNCRKPKALSLKDVTSQLIKLTDNKLELMEYAGVIGKSSKFKCTVCNYNFSTPFKSLRQNLHLSNTPKTIWGCARCSNKKQKTTKEYAQEIETLFNGKLQIIGDYVNVQTPVLTLCKVCNHKWLTSPSTLLKGSQCVGCLRLHRDSQGVRNIVKFLDDNGIMYEREVGFSELKYKSHLYFDFCIETVDNFFLIEFDGQQHFRGWQGCSSSLSTNKIRDSIKTKFCTDNNLPLLRLDYTMTSFDLKNNLKNFLDHYKLF